MKIDKKVSVHLLDKVNGLFQREDGSNVVVESFIQVLIDWDLLPELSYAQDKHARVDKSKPDVDQITITVECKKFPKVFCPICKKGLELKLVAGQKLNYLPNLQWYSQHIGERQGCPYPEQCAFGQTVEEAEEDLQSKIDNWNEWLSKFWSSDNEEEKEEDK